MGRDSSIVFWVRVFSRMSRVAMNICWVLVNGIGCEMGAGINGETFSAGVEFSGIVMK